MRWPALRVARALWRGVPSGAAGSASRLGRVTRGSPVRYGCSSCLYTIQTIGVATRATSGCYAADRVDDRVLRQAVTHVLAVGRPRREAVVVGGDRGVVRTLEIE